MSKNHTSEEPDFVAGRNPVIDLLKADPDRVAKVYLVKGTGGTLTSKLKNLARPHSISVQTVPLARIERSVPGVNHQGVVAILSGTRYTDVHELLTACGPMREDVQRDKPVVLLLDRIQDPYNFGAIIRSAVASGAGGIIIPDREAAPLNAAAMKSSAGAATRIPVARTSNMLQILEEMKERGYWVVGADGSSKDSVWDMDFDRPLAIVIGNEEKGMRASVAKACDFTVKIPMNGPVESLNASVAAGIILFAAAKGR
jgi:23S rRNA (guanosine2251-2'-O)-methyltransferase